MPNKLPATGKKVSGWFIHLVIFAIVNAFLWYICYHGKIGWVYPWPSWITAAWGLTIVAHACLVWANYEDKYHDEWTRQANNG
jgi:hypothetical protein